MQKTRPDTPENEARRAKGREYTARYRERRRQYYDRHRARFHEYNRWKAYERRRAVLAHYSGGDPRCACCGETTVWFLTIDHPNNDGHVERRTKGNGGTIGVRLLRQGLPAGYRVLCYNCNLGRAHSPDPEKRCPHVMPPPVPPPRPARASKAQQIVDLLHADPTRVWRARDIWRTLGFSEAFTSATLVDLLRYAPVVRVRRGHYQAAPAPR